MILFFFYQTVGFAGAEWFAGPAILLAAIVAGFEGGSRSDHPGGMPHWNLLHISDVTVGCCKCYGPYFLSFLPCWTRNSHWSVDVDVLTPLGVGDGRQWLLVELTLGILAPLG